MQDRAKKDTGWSHVDKWYDDIVGKEGHYYHQHVILPRLLPLLDLASFSAPSLLDLACGQGVLARHLPASLAYTGIDLSAPFIELAKKQQTRCQQFLVGDICQPLPLPKHTFSHAAIILALQNVAEPQLVLKNASHHLIERGRLVIVLNHPSFRIPRQSQWGVDEKKKLQYRRVDRYMSPLKIPIQTHPSQREHSPATYSFHYPLSDYSRFLAQAGFVIEQIEEWKSDKVSTGKAARMENRAREEFPLFLTLVAVKI